MTADASSTAEAGHETIKIAGLSLTFHDVAISSETLSGAQISVASGFETEHESTILKILPNGELEEVRPDDVVALCDSTRKFVIVRSDRSYKLMINGVWFDWPWRVISGGQLRKLGQVPAKMEVYLNLPDHVERVIHEHDLVDLNTPGVEAFKTRQRQWKLNVQGVILDVHEPTIVVRQAIKDAGFEPNKSWIIILRVRGEAKREVDLDFVIDLRTPGIEKLRLTPKEVNNGDAPSAPCRQFDLLETDEGFLNGLGLFWETIVDNMVANKSRRWLLIHKYPVPAGFTVEHTLLGLEIPLTYPGAQIDMFYTSPPLTLKSGRAIDRTQVSATILDTLFNGWSRHRGAMSQWKPASDNVSTHLALVESAMAKETGE